MANLNEESSRAAYNPQQQSKSASSFASTRQQAGDDIHLKVRYGTIVKAWEGEDDTGKGFLRIAVRFDNKLDEIQKGSYANSFSLTHTIGEISALYGTIDDIVGLRVSVVSNGSRLNQGLASIVSQNGQGSLEKAHIISPFGTFLAPAGGSSI